MPVKINEEEPRDFDDLSAFELIDLRNELIDAKLTDIALDEIMTILRSKNDFEIVLGEVHESLAKSN